jgi:cyanophycin synthetase
VKRRSTLKDVPITRGGVIGFQVENVMASVAAAWAVNLDWDKIRLGLKTFVGESDNAPGRFNVFDYKGATLIADYGHNPDAIAALVSAVENMPAKRRSVVISGAGDRRDQDITQQTEILGNAFDDVLLYQDQCQRGRPGWRSRRAAAPGFERRHAYQPCRGNQWRVHCDRPRLGALERGRFVPDPDRPGR